MTRACARGNSLPSDLSPTSLIFFNIPPVLPHLRSGLTESVTLLSTATWSNIAKFAEASGLKLLWDFNAVDFRSDGAWAADANATGLLAATEVRSTLRSGDARPSPKRPRSPSRAAFSWGQKLPHHAVPHPSRPSPAERRRVPARPRAPP